jgi:Uma2 family endonuclease
MSEPAVKHISIAEYLEMERAAIEKHEYYKGEIFAMSGARVKHNRIQMNFLGATHGFLRGKDCEVFGSDLRIHIPSNSLFTYPDAVIICNGLELLDEEFDTVLNPKVIVEVLSKSTQSYDRGDKFNLYRAIPSLKEYIMISSETIGLEHYIKQENNTWLLKEYSQLSDSLLIQSIDFSILLSELYAGVEI